MARRGKRDRGKEWFWRRLLRQWRRSGHNVRDFCAEQRLSEPSFYAWRRTIEERDRRAAQQGRRQAKGLPKDMAGRCPSDGLPSFVPVTITAPTPSLEVALADGRVVRVPTGFDPATLRQLLAVLDGAPSC